MATMGNCLYAVSDSAWWPTPTPTTSNTTPSAQNIWVNWNGHYVTVTTAGSAQTQIVAYPSVTSPWGAWNDCYYQYQSQQMPYQGQQQANCALTEQDRQRHAQALIDAETKRKSAEAKAEELLMLYLTDEQKASYKEKGYFETATNDRRYRLYRGSNGNIKEIDEKGKEIARLCVNAEGVPHSDNVLAQLLALMTDENYLLSRANRTRLI